MKTKIYGLILIAVFAFAGCELLEDPDTDSDIRDEIKGEWKVAEDSQRFGKSYYNTNIEKDLSDSSQIFFQDFYGFDGLVINAKIDGYDIDIPDQSGRGAIFQDGYGIISSNFRTISLYYYVDLQDGESRDIVEAIYTRP